MNMLERWVLNFIVRKMVQQGPYHQYRTKQLFMIIRQAWADEFTEDNNPSRAVLLNEIFEESRLDHESANSTTNNDTTSVHGDGWRYP